MLCLLCQPCMNEIYSSAIEVLSWVTRIKGFAFSQVRELSDIVPFGVSMFCQKLFISYYYWFLSKDYRVKNIGAGLDYNVMFFFHLDEEI